MFMDRVFKSKIGWWYHLLIVILAVLCVASALQDNTLLIVASTVACAFALHVFFNTYYVVTADGRLVLHCSFFPEKEIAVGDIEALQPSILPAPSYALSLDRIIIWKEGKMWMLVSPQNEKEFVKLLKGFNPDIEIMRNESFQM